MYKGSYIFLLYVYIFFFFSLSVCLSCNMRATFWYDIYYLGRFRSRGLQVKRCLPGVFGCSEEHFFLSMVSIDRFSNAS